MMPKVVKAALKGFIMFLLTYLLPTLMVETMMPAEIFSLMDGRKN